MAFGSKSNSDGGFPKNDRGSGSFNDYRFDLIPKSKKTVMRLADSDPHQDELRRLLETDSGQLETAGGRRTAEEERTDAPMEVRLFTGTRVSDVVGIVPRGLEAAIDQALNRLERESKLPRIPAQIVTTRHGLRVELLMGTTR